jgi:hypothetical protein
MTNPKFLVGRWLLQVTWQRLDGGGTDGHDPRL